MIHICILIQYEYNELFQNGISKSMERFLSLKVLI